MTTQRRRVLAGTQPGAGLGGLGAAGDPDLIERIARVTAREILVADVRGTGAQRDPASVRFPFAMA